MLKVDVLLQDGTSIIDAVKRNDYDAAQAVEAVQTLCPDWLQIIVTRTLPGVANEQA